MKIEFKAQVEGLSLDSSGWQVKLKGLDAAGGPNYRTWATVQVSKEQFDQLKFEQVVKVDDYSLDACPTENYYAWWKPEEAPGRKFMTICIAVLCENAKTILLVADRMVGLGFIEAEPEISKTFRLHRLWRVMLAGDDISPAFDIVDKARGRLQGNDAPDVQQVMDAITISYEEKRLALAVASHLTPRGWTLERFRNEGRDLLGESIHRQLDSMIAGHKLLVTLLIAGFEGDQGRVFSVQNPGIATRHDIPGFYAIGSGNIGALYMLFFRAVGPRIRLPEAFYYAFEAKYFAELAGGVGVDTDAYILRVSGGKLETKVGTGTKRLMFKMCEAMQPAEMPRELVSGIRDLRELSGIKPKRKLAKALSKKGTRPQLVPIIKRLKPQKSKRQQ